MSNASKSFTSMQATRSHRRDVNGMVGQWSTFNQMRTFLREICVPLKPADPLKSTASAALQNGLMFQPHSESTSFTSMGQTREASARWAVLRSRKRLEFVSAKRVQTPLQGVCTTIERTDVGSSPTVTTTRKPL